MKKRILYQVLFLIITGLLIQCDGCKPKTNKKAEQPNPQKPPQPASITEEMIHVAETYTGSYASFIDGFLVHMLRKLKDSPSEIDINTKDSSMGEKMTALHYAAILGNEDIVKALLDRGAKVDILDNDKALPLHYAAMSQGNAKILTFLLDRGDVAHLKMKYVGSTPLELATDRAKDPEMIKLLQERERQKDRQQK